MALPKRLLTIVASCALVLLAAATGAQETKKTVAAKNFEIISVDGNKVVYRTREGVKEITLADDFKLDMDGKQIGLGDLKPGMKGTAYLTTTTTTQPVVVTEVRNATVLKVAGTTIIVRGQQGIRKFTIDEVRDKNITIMREGERVDLMGLHEGDKLTATIITRLPPVVMTEAELSASVSAPPPAPAPTMAPAAAPAAAPTMAPAPASKMAPTAAPAEAPAAVPTAEAAPATAAAPPAATPAEEAAKSKFPIVTLLIVLLVVVVLILMLRSRKRSP